MSDYRLRPKAVEDLEVIGYYIAANNPARAVSFIDELFDLFGDIAARPTSFQRRDDLAVGLRQAVHGRYLILFTDHGDEVVIERVLHGARRSKTSSDSNAYRSGAAKAGSGVVGTGLPVLRSR